MIKIPKLIMFGEMFFALFLVSGTFKATFHLPIDLTIMFLLLSFLSFCKRFIEKPQINKYIIVPLVLYACLIAICLLSLYWTKSSVYAMDKTLRFMFITGWAFLGALLLLNKKESAKKFLFNMVLISTCESIFSIYLFLTNSSTTGFIGIDGENYLSTARLIGLGAMLLMANYFYGKNKLSTVVLLIIHGFALLATGARMPLIAFILIFLIMTFRGIRYEKGIIYYTKNTKYILILFMLVVIAATFIMKSGVFSTTISRLEVLFTEHNGGNSANGRIERYKVALEMFKNHPVFGCGIGSFPLFFSSIDSRDYPHNIFLELLSETGMVGFLVFICSVTIAITRFYKANKNNKYNILCIAIFISFLYMFLNAMISGDINDNRLLFTFIALSSILPILSSRNTQVN
jgi:O-antigen ligase